MLKINRKKDERVVHACTNNCADIPNGVTVNSTELVAGSVLKEGSALAKDASTGLYHVCKTALVVENVSNSDTDIEVAKGSQFKVGEYVMAKAGAKAYAISEIDKSNAAYDKITVGTTLGIAISKGESIQQAAAGSSSTTSALKYVPTALTGDSYDVDGLSNVAVVAVTIGQFKESIIPPVSADMKKTLTGIVFI